MMDKMPMTHNHRLSQSEAFKTIMHNVNPDVSATIFRDVRDPVDRTIHIQTGMQLHQWLRNQ